MENFNFKKVRNFQNLYEYLLDRHNTKKAREILERQRLGHKKVWLLDKLPPIEMPQLGKVDQGGKNFDSIQTSTSQQLILKRIQRDQEGQIEIQSQKEPALNSKEIDQERILASMKPLLRKNLFHNDNNVILTFKSFEVFIIDDEFTKPRVFNPVYVPLSQIKELLSLSKKQLELRLMEGIIYDKVTSQFTYRVSPKKQQSSPKRKPSVVRNKFEDKKTVTPKKSQLEATLLEVPEFIYSSIYVEHLSKDFRVTVKAPTVEYTIPAKHFGFLKMLSTQDIKEYIDSSFLAWEATLIKSFTSHSKFLEITSNLSKSLKPQAQFGFTQSKFNSRNSLKQEQQHEEEQHRGNIKISLYLFAKESKFFDSWDELQEERILQKSAKLRGCFDRQGIIGNIQLKSFQLKIKGLSNSYEHRESIELSEWHKLLNFMRKAAKMDPDNPQQLIELVAEVFNETLKKGTKFSMSHVKHLNNYVKDVNKKKSDKKHKRSVSMSKIVTSYFKPQKRSKMLTVQSSQDRYLLEFQYPLAKVFLEEEQIIRTLNEGDCEYLVDKKFSNWKQYIMNQHYRLELNIGTNEPLPRINEVRKEEEGDVFSEVDFREKYPPKDEKEKKTIIETRETLSQWFPI